MKLLNAAIVSLSAFVLVGCAQVDVTKTSKGTYAATVADDVEVLVTRPDRAYEELGTLSVVGWNPSETAKMHNALRAKSAPLGANAVILANSGINPDGKIWGTGVAIRWK